MGSLLGYRRFLNDLGHEGPVLEGFDLKSNRLSQHQVIMSLPAPVGLAFAEIPQFLQVILDFEQEIEFIRRLIPFLNGGLY